ncbi:hypothetical protein HMPREF1624_08164 [Sporothrix schenckii ATCC 58251]|uniref:Major facilitator superfamily (MFS) profile domain-containing protein n=1 Tax=Sporothrix schenckii (strain ATCC 58251 / de Perez 2211183) TaxID=1391915 RepID=U7PK20_SPOS1|nr:hypothetical protein HMPREF1624_08164 [Sporothrix schenckii ATCC 58251]
MGNDETSPDIVVEKPAIGHVEQSVLEEIGHAKVDGYVSYGLAKSRFDNLTIPQTIWTFKRVVLIIISVYTGYICEGFELNSSGSVIANAGFIKQFGSGDTAGVRSLSATWVSTWSALLNVGQILTFTHISWFADKFGRKASFYLAWTWLAIGCMFLNVAKSPSVWALGKLCNGAGIGVLQVTCQIYAMEVSPNKIRGGLVTFQAVWSDIGGIIIAVMMQQLNSKYPDNYLLAMRILWAPVGLMLICWILAPESPWFHARHGNKNKALKCMKQLYGGVKGYDFEEEYSIIEKTIEHEKDLLTSKINTLEIFKGVNLKRTLTVMVLSAAQQLAGLVIISTYSTYFFSLAGLTDPFLATVILAYATPPMLLAMGVKSGFVFGAFSVPICIIMWLTVPETKGRSAAEIDELYERKIPVWRWTKTVTAVEEEMQTITQIKGGSTRPINGAKTHSA